MAFWNRQGKRVYVYTYDSSAGKQKALPRKLTKHLDGEPTHNIQAWVDQYALQYENKKFTKQTFIESKKLNNLVDLFGQYLKKRRRAEPTIQKHKSLLKRTILPYFLLADEQIYSDPNNWPGISIKLLDYLQEKGLSDTLIETCNTSLRLFWNWLGDERYLTTPYELRLRNPVREDKETPLKRILTPDEVMTFVRASDDDEMKLLALLGYFFSLRPFEQFALRPIDFRAGSEAAERECCTVMGRFGLYNRLAVNIHRQRIKSGDFTTPKAHSRGWVSCFHKEAAAEIVKLLKGREPEEVLFPHHADWLFVKWRRKGIKQVALKDLRRASLYYLGHHTSFELTALMHHARHKKVETTRLYLRRPEDNITTDWGELDLDA